MAQQSGRKRRATDNPSNSARKRQVPETPDSDATSGHTLRDQPIIAPMTDIDFVSTIIIIEVGTDGSETQTFYLHKAVAESRVEYFRDLCVERAAETKPVFNTTPIYTYNPRLFKRSSAALDDGGKFSAYLPMVHLFRLAEMLKVPTLADQVVSWMMRRAKAGKGLPSVGVINKVYHETQKSHPLRKLMLELWACEGREENTDQLEGVVKEFSDKLRNKQADYYQRMKEGEDAKAIEAPEKDFYLSTYLEHWRSFQRAQSQGDLFEID
ncbi:hypothetical protein NA57DRAFT_59444 [Rhizodiscina lignyota]|uniref:BTB domain-containing protein n=1 Tax=Rhizodiscina lignyota TaxID=1504668 RepID=A0A9P4I5M4_9PEZI|nr:hypothetical protein NA57DRAFT_59444 [Rhizodiscina lignyota]